MQYCVAIHAIGEGLFTRFYLTFLDFQTACEMCCDWVCQYNRSNNLFNKGRSLHSACLRKCVLFIATNCFVDWKSNYSGIKTYTRTFNYYLLLCVLRQYRILVFNGNFHYVVPLQSWILPIDISPGCIGKVSYLSLKNLTCAFSLSCERSLHIWRVCVLRDVWPLSKHAMWTKWKP